MSRLPDTFWCLRRLVLTVTGPDGRSEELRLDKPYARIGTHPDSEVVLSEADLPARCCYLHGTDEGVFCYGLIEENAPHAVPTGWMSSRSLLRIGQTTIRVRFADTLSISKPDEPDLRLHRQGHSGGVRLLIRSEQASLPPTERHCHSPLTLVGRRRPSVVRLKHETISKTHCVLYNPGNALWVIDLLSANGTQVDGASIECVRLMPGQTVQLGAARLSIGDDQAAGSGSGESPVATAADEESLFEPGLAANDEDEPLAFDEVSVDIASPMSNSPLDEPAADIDLPSNDPFAAGLLETVQLQPVGAKEDDKAPSASGRAATQKDDGIDLADLLDESSPVPAELDLPQEEDSIAAELSPPLEPAFDAEVESQTITAGNVAADNDAASDIPAEGLSAPEPGYASPEPPLPVKPAQAKREQRLKQQLAAAKQRARESEQRILEVERLLTEARRQAEQGHQQLATLESELTATRTKHTEVQTQLDLLKQQVQTAAAADKRQRDAEQRLTAELTDALAARDRISAQLTEQQRELEQARQQQHDIEQLANRLDEAEKGAAERQQELAQLQGELAAERTASLELRQQIDQLQQQKLVDAAATAALTSQAAELQAMSDTAVARQRKTDQQLTKLRQELAAAEKQREQALTQAAQRGAELQRATEQQAILQQQLETLQIELTERQRESDSLGAQLAAFSAAAVSLPSVEASAAETSTEPAELVELRKAYDQLQQELERQRNQSRDEHARLAEDQTAALEQLALRDTELVNLRNQLQQTTEAAAEQLEQTARLQQERDRYQAEVLGVQRRLTDLIRRAADAEQELQRRTAPHPLESKIAELEQALSSAAAARVAIERQLAETSERHTGSQRELEQTHQQVNSLQRRLTRLKRQARRKMRDLKSQAAAPPAANFLATADQAGLAQPQSPPQIEFEPFADEPDTEAVEPASRSPASKAAEPDMEMAEVDEAECPEPYPLFAESDAVSSHAKTAQESAVSLSTASADSPAANDFSVAPPVPHVAPRPAATRSMSTEAGASDFIDRLLVYRQKQAAGALRRRFIFWGVALAVIIVLLAAAWLLVDWATLIPSVAQPADR